MRSDSLSPSSVSDAPTAPSLTVSVFRFIGCTAALTMLMLFLGSLQ